MHIQHRKSFNNFSAVAEVIAMVQMMCKSVFTLANDVSLRKFNAVVTFFSELVYPDRNDKVIWCTTAKYLTLTTIPNNVESRNGGDRNI